MSLVFGLPYPSSDIPISYSPSFNENLKENKKPSANIGWSKTFKKMMSNPLYDNFMKDYHQRSYYMFNELA